jgi:D-aminoacyl-tRNA deacylase
VRAVRALVQRVSEARVRVDGEVVGEIGAGLCVFVGVTHSDTDSIADRLAEKVWRLRIFDDEQENMGVAVADTGGGILVISQFTLYGDTTRGRRPSWIDAARPEQAEPLIDRFVQALRASGAEVATGRFRADMAVELVNDGPVTVMAEI